MKFKNAMLLLLTATIWGVAFVAQSVGMDYVGPLTFNCVRSLIGSAVLLPCIWFLNRREEGGQAAGKGAETSRNAAGTKKGDRRTLLIGGLCCGIALCFASNFQQFGIQYTSVGKAGFITACYIVIVPIMGLFFKKKCSPIIAGAVALSVAVI